MTSELDKEDALTPTQVPALEYVPTSELASEIIRRCDHCIVIMSKPANLEDGCGAMHFHASFDFDRLAHMCGVAHSHLWLMAQGGGPSRQRIPR